jgi:DNA-binding NarL/FixJ family response regulator
MYSNANLSSYIYAYMKASLSRRRQMKVLIADDSAVVVERLSDLLKEIPTVELVGRAGTVSEAIDSIKEMSPDAVILDLQMPGGSGLDVLRAVRPGHPSLQILICTNYPYAKYRDECLTAGANFFLDKSTEFEKIPAIFRELIRAAPKAAPAGRS